MAAAQQPQMHGQQQLHGQQQQQQQQQHHQNAWADPSNAYATYMTQAYPPHGNPYGAAQPPFYGFGSPTDLSPVKQARKGPRTGGFVR